MVTLAGQQGSHPRTSPCVATGRGCACCIKRKIMFEADPFELWKPDDLQSIVCETIRSAVRRFRFSASKRRLMCWNTESEMVHCREHLRGLQRAGEEQLRALCRAHITPTAAEGKHS
ncbi:uncharacterized protein GJ701_008095 [Geothlypis trichas]